MDVDIKFLAQARNKLSDADVFTILKWTKKTFGNNVAMTTAFGYGGVVLLHHVLKIIPDLKIYFIDTGFHFPETLKLMQNLEKRWDIKFNVIKPSISLKQLVKLVGENPWEINPDLCCHYMKVEPFLKVIHKKDAWINALRKDQSSTRAELDVIEIDGRGTIKIYPLVNWTFDDCWNYIKENKLPYNPLHDQNMFSIGCKYCTIPIKNGEHERSGRWNSMLKLECGLHIHKSK